ncbi:hypothetical protein BB14905_15700 [Bacillus sp. B14905]|nr:hypothetical protein BB14905_15700 [Bacillus sp. B14905]
MKKTEISKKGDGFLCWRDAICIDSGNKNLFLINDSTKEDDG